MGAALGTVHIMSMNANGTPYNAAARAILAERDESEVTHAGQCATRFTDDARFSSYEASIRDYLRRISSERGEQAAG